MANSVNGFYKVAQNGGTFVTATMFNPITNEVKVLCVRDYDYDDCSRDNDEIYYMDIDEDARKAYLKFKGIVSIGHEVEVIKGRKVPIGTVGVVEKVYDWKDNYGRVQSTYAVLDNGVKVNVNNCKIVG